MSRRRGRGLRALVVLWIVPALVLAVAGPAAADPAGPTDYQTSVVEITPPADGIDVRILGGDSFVELTVDPGVEVLVVGYRGEPYLRFDADGTVWQNDRSTSRWLNDNRYETEEIPPQADDAAEPDWIVVATDGVFAWHDHRSHWMNRQRPIGIEPGGTVLEETIPLEVDGQEVEVHVRSILLAGPSPLPALSGAALGLGVAAAVLFGIRRRGDRVRLPGRPSPPVVPLLLVTAAWALLATGLGLAAVAGLPPVAAPGPTRWLLPGVALVVCLAGVVMVVRRLLAPPLRDLLVPAVLIVAGLELTLWAWLRRQVVDRALIPTPAPEWLDRFGVAGAAATGLVALVAGAALLIRELRPAPRR